MMRKLFCRLGKDKSGMAAVEFALVIPIMLTFFFGLVEVGQALSARADVANMAGVGADLIAQESAVTSADLSNVYGALGAMMFPYSTTGMKITITSIIDSGTAGVGTVKWSCTHGGTARTVGASYTLPNTSLITAGSGGSVILTEISYAYTSSAGTFMGTSGFIGSPTWNNSFYSKPRNVAQIPAPSSCP